MAEKQVRQALALGRLSPKIRQAWREGEIKAEVAQAFTLGLDHKTQDKLSRSWRRNDLDRHSIRAELGVKPNEDIGVLVNFVGMDAYRARGGHVTEDLFKEQHIVSDDVLLKAMVGERLRRNAIGWSSSRAGSGGVEADLPKSWRSWPTTRVDVAKFFTPEEEACAKELAKREDEIEKAL
jgi:ParB family chromosome partitioning protein